MRLVNHVTFAALIALTAAMPGPAVAADETETPANPITEQTERLTQQAALEAAHNKLINERIKALGLESGATGTTTRGDKAGNFEGWLLSANAINAAAGSMADRLHATPMKGKRIVLLAADEAFDLGLPAAMKQRIAAIDNRARSAFEASCAAPAKPPIKGGPLAAAAPVAAAVPALAGAIPYIGALLGALKTDTTIVGTEGPTDARLLVNAMAKLAETDDVWVVPSDISSVSGDSELGDDWADLSNRRARIATCRAGLAGKAKKDDEAAKARINALDVVLAEIDLFEKNEVLGGNGVSPLVQAIRLESMAADPDLHVVRVYVEKAGGSLLQRSNLFTMLGAPAIGMTGGAVVGWRAVNATTGKVGAGGNLSCRTALTNMRAIHAGRVRPSSCEWR